MRNCASTLSFAECKIRGNLISITPATIEHWHCAAIIMSCRLQNGHRKRAEVLRVETERWNEITMQQFVSAAISSVVMILLVLSLHPVSAENATRSLSASAPFHAHQPTTYRSSLFQLLGDTAHCWKPCGTLNCTHQKRMKKV